MNTAASPQPGLSNVNRVWKRCFGTGLIEPVDQWNDGPAASHPERLHFLSADFIESGYDLKALNRRILNSDYWQRHRQRRARMSAERLVDSLFVAVGKDFQAETLGIHATDPGAIQRLVLIKRADHPVAVLPGPGERQVALETPGVRVTGHVEPVPVSRRSCDS